MTDVTITISGVDLAGVADRLDNLQPALDAIGAYCERLTREALVRGQTVGGRPLAPLSPNTIADKRRRGKSTAILRSDGGLLASLSYARTSATEVQVGTNLEYAPWVILGTRPYQIRPRKQGRLRFYTAGGWRSAKTVNHPGLPRRNIFEGMADAAAAGITKRLRDYLGL